MVEFKKGDLLDLTKKPEEIKYVYIAGKITGLPNYREVFKEAESKLNELGYICMNPAELPEGFPYDIYLPICYKMIDACDVLYMLSNYIDSNGANCELSYGITNSKEVYFQKGDDVVEKETPILGERKQTKVEAAKSVLDSKGILYTEMQYGQLQIDRINFWATTEKWHDPIRKQKGVGLNSFLKHLKDNNIV